MLLFMGWPALCSCKVDEQRRLPGLPVEPGVFKIVNAVIVKIGLYGLFGFTEVDGLACASVIQLVHA